MAKHQMDPPENPKSSKLPKQQQEQQQPPLSPDEGQAYAIVQTQNGERILIAKKQQTNRFWNKNLSADTVVNQSGQYAPLAGGKIDPGDQGSAVRTAARELQEECGIDINTFPGGQNITVQHFQGYHLVTYTVEDNVFQTIKQTIESNIAPHNHKKGKPAGQLVKDWELESVSEVSGNQTQQNWIGSKLGILQQTKLTMDMREVKVAMDDIKNTSMSQLPEDPIERKAWYKKLCNKTRARYGNGNSFVVNGNKYALDEFNKMINGANRQDIDWYRQIATHVSSEYEKAQAAALAAQQDQAEEKAHLKRHEKYTVIGSTGKEKYNLAAELRKSVASHDMAKLQEEARRTAKEDMENLVAQSNVQNQKGSVKLIPETNHGRQHGANVDQLIAQIKSGELDQNSVICLERKQAGANLGMPDVVTLANALKHNETTPERPIELPEGIEKSLIYKDAQLYNAARDHGIKVVGVEGKGLEHSKESPLYNKTREEYMAGTLTKMANTGKNVVLVVGDAHKENLKSILLGQGLEVEVAERDKAQSIIARLAGENGEVGTDRHTSPHTPNTPGKNNRRENRKQGNERSS